MRRISFSIIFAFLILLSKIIVVWGVENNLLDTPPILLNNPFYNVYKSIIKVSLKLPLNSFARAEFLNRVLGELLYNIGFGLQNDYNINDLVNDFTNYSNQLSNVLKGWVYFKNKEKVILTSKNIQLSIFQYTLALSEKPLDSLTPEIKLTLFNSLKTLASATYYLLGPQVTIQNLKSLSNNPEKDIYLVTALFSDNNEILEPFSQLIDYRVFISYKDKDPFVVLERLIDYLTKILPKESKLIDAIMALNSSLKQLKEKLDLFQQNKVILKDSQKFEETYQSLSKALEETKNYVLKGDLESALTNLNKINEIIQAITKLFESPS